jgi:hypothetical protein
MESGKDDLGMADHGTYPGPLDIVVFGDLDDVRQLQ